MTRLRHILVHLDGGDATAARLSLAAALAAREGARLLGAFAEHGFPHRAGLKPGWAEADHDRATAASRARFAEATRGLADTDWRDLSATTPGAAADAVIAACRTADLAVIGQTGAKGGLAPPDLAELTVRNAGRPVLVVPYAGVPETLGARPVFAWNGSREAARALHDALPLLAPEARAVVITVRADAEAGADADVLAQLRRHGVSARGDVLRAGGVGLMDLLLNRIADLGGDLLAMGAYGHYGFPQLARGGGTRHVLAHMTVPVLFSR